MIERTHAREPNLSDLVKFLTARLRMKTKDSRIGVVIVITVITLFLLWAGALVYAYIADDRSDMPADERSVPAPRSY
jgi:hypothetical protein